MSYTPTAALVLADGQVFYGEGCGADGIAPGEVCFNTAMTGYQEILTDPSYAEQIICFTFPHIGNVGTNNEDEEAAIARSQRAAVGAIFKAPITAPSNWRSDSHLDDWMKTRNIIGISGLDTRALTAYIRDNGMPNGVIAHNQDGEFDIPALVKQAAEWAGLVGLDLAKEVHTNAVYNWRETRWIWPDGFGQKDGLKRVVLIDYGVKRNIMRLLASLNLAVTVVPATMKAADILKLDPDGIIIKNLVESGLPIFGICLGHQLLALALGGKTIKMEQGHHGANHPVMDHTTNKVEIVSMNHGFAVDAESLPDKVEATHVSLFDGSNCGIALKDKPVFSVQHHPEASPGPQDSFYIFERFAKAL